MQKQKHWADDLKQGDRVRGTIRARKEGEQNLIGVDLIVTRDAEMGLKHVWCHHKDTNKEYAVPFMDLKRE